MDKTNIIWKQFHDRLLQFIKQRVGDPHTAEDLLQDVFIKIHNNIDSLKDDLPVGPWVYKIARNTIIDHYRSSKTQAEIQKMQLPDDRNTKNEARSEIMADIKTIISDLPDKYRQALLLTEFDGLSQKQLARHLNLSDSGAKSRVQRARKMIRDDLMRCCHYIFDRYNQVIDYHPHGCCCCQGE